MAKVKRIEIPALKQNEMTLTIAGDRPLLVCNKMNVAADVAAQYDGQGKTGAVKPPKDSVDVQYAKAFYVMPDSKYPAPHPKTSCGIVASGLKKCVDKAIRTTGIVDNTTIGSISRAFFILADRGGLCRITFDKLERDVRPVNIGSGQKTVPQMRHRPMFHGWKCKVRIRYNPVILSEEQIVNLFMHAGAYIGWGELRAEKKQGECGGFVVEGNAKKARGSRRKQ